jgi:hypothetical protein
MASDSFYWDAWLLVGILLCGHYLNMNGAYLLKHQRFGLIES